MIANSKLHWDDLRIILTIGREGGLSAAARALGTSHSTVFRQINEIENKYSTRFFSRQTNGYEPTEAGELVMRFAENIEDQVQNLNRELLGKDLRLQGKIILTAPEGVSHYILMPHLASFQEQHPDIDIELRASPDLFELSRSEADLAIRVTDTPPDNCIAKKISDFRLAFYASPEYLSRNTSGNLLDYEYVLCTLHWNKLCKSLWKNQNKPRVKLLTDKNILASARAAIEGIGVSLLPCLIGEKEAGLQRIGDPIEQKSTLWVMTHADLRQTSRVKILMNHLFESMQTERIFVECNKV